MKTFSWSLCVVGALAVLWHGMGWINFFMQQNPGTFAQLPESHQAIAESRPVWVTFAFALSFVTGILGGITLLMNYNGAVAMFYLSLLGALVATIHGIAIGNALNLFTPFEIVLALIGPVLVGICFFWYAKKAESNGWIYNLLTER